MRVLHVLDVSVPILAGYASRSRSIVHHQSALGHVPSVVTSPRHASPVESETIDGIHYHRTHVRKTHLPQSIVRQPLLLEGREMTATFRRILQAASKEKAEIIHAHSPILCGLPAYAAAKRLGIPCVYEIRAFWEDAAVDAETNREGSPKYRAIQAGEKWLVEHVDAPVAICKGIREDLRRRGVKREIFLAENGVSVGSFVPRPKNSELLQKYGLEGKTVVGYIGTFAPFEGVPDLVTALIQILSDGDEVRGLIIGKGATHSACREAVRAAGLSNKIHVLDPIPHELVPDYYSVTDILVYPRTKSRITDLVTPLKPLEAMAMEKTVIGSNVGGLKELIREGETGLIYPAGDASALKRVILSAARDVDLRARLGTNGRAYVTNERTWEGLARHYQSVYQAALTHHGRSSGSVWPFRPGARTP
jgi:glycogen synthase